MSRWSLAALAAGGGAIALALAPAVAAPSGKTLTKPRVGLGARGSLSAFTPADADPRLAAALARGGLIGSGFRFTPSSTGVRVNRSVTVAVRARINDRAAGGERVALVAAPAQVGIAPIAYNLGVAVGWKRFALSGDVQRVESLAGGREAVDVGVSYNTRNWSARVGAGADVPLVKTGPRTLAEERGYSLDVGGSYRLTRNLDVTAGVRYRAAERDRLLPAADAKRDSQAVYVGTAFKF